MYLHIARDLLLFAPKLKRKGQSDEYCLVLINCSRRNLERRIILMDGHQFTVFTLFINTRKGNSYLTVTQVKSIRLFLGGEPNQRSSQTVNFIWFCGSVPVICGELFSSGCSQLLFLSRRLFTSAFTSQASHQLVWYGDWCKSVCVCVCVCVCVFVCV